MSTGNDSPLLLEDNIERGPGTKIRLHRCLIQVTAPLMRSHVNVRITHLTAKATWPAMHETVIDVTVDGTAVPTRRVYSLL